MEKLKRLIEQKWKTGIELFGVCLALLGAFNTWYLNLDIPGLPSSRATMFLGLALLGTFFVLGRVWPGAIYAITRFVFGKVPPLSDTTTMFLRPRPYDERDASDKLVGRLGE